MIDNSSILTVRCWDLPDISLNIVICSNVVESHGNGTSVASAAWVLQVFLAIYQNALNVVDKIIAGGMLDRRDIELLIEKIVVDEDGMPEITLKYGLSNLIQYSPADEMNRRENTTIAIVMKLISEDERGYTSAKYLSEHITDLGLKKTKQSILPYIELAKSLGILEPTENSLKPYRIVKSKEEIIEEIKKHSRNYAKRQYTWFNNQFDVHWYDVNLEDFASTIQNVLKDIKEWYEKG